MTAPVPPFGGMTTCDLFGKGVAQAERHERRSCHLMAASGPPPLEHLTGAGVAVMPRTSLYLNSGAANSVAAPAFSEAAA